MADIQGLDVLMVLIVSVAVFVIIMIMFQALKIQLTFRSVAIMNFFSYMLGILTESWFRETRELALATVGMAGLVIVWVVLKVRSSQRHRGG